MSRARQMRTLASIIAQAEKLRPASEEADPQMFYLVGGIIVNAEDALGALKNEREREELDGLLAGMVREATR